MPQFLQGTQLVEETLGPQILWKTGCKLLCHVTSLDVDKDLQRKIYAITR